MKMKKQQMIIVGVIMISILMLAGCTSNNGGENNQDADETDSNDDSDGYAVNVDKNLVGNWTWISGSNNGEPVTYISSGWVAFNKDGTWAFVHDRGHFIQAQSGTFQTEDGELYWGTTGSEISDWYSQDSYEVINDNELIITSGSSEMMYEK